MLLKKQRTDFFVQESKLKNKATTKSVEDNNIEIGMLVTAKKMGLSFEELNLFSLDDYLTFVDKWTGNEEEGTREASQSDIERFMG